MAAKSTIVTLVTKDGRQTRDFDIAHAERILRIPTTAWQLPDNSKFTFENGSINRKAKTSVKRGMEPADDK